MRQLLAWLTRFGGMFRRKEREAELAAELESHLQMHIEDNLRAGITPEEARRQALIKLGGMEQAKERYREQQRLPWVEALWQDLHFGARVLIKSPGFTTIALLTLGLGVGANTAVFSVINTVLLKPLPYRDPERIVMVHEKISLPSLTDDVDMVPAGDFSDWTNRDTPFEDMAAIKYRSLDLTGTGEPVRIEGGAVSASLFSILRVDPMMGRVFSREEDRYGGPRVVLLSYGLWVNRFGANPGLIGQPIRLNEEDYTVIGVMPKWFHFPDPDDQLWVPLDLSPEDLADHAHLSVLAVGRIKHARGISDAQAQMDTIGDQLAREYPATHAGMSAHVISLRDQIVGDVRLAILILWGCTTFVLLIVCANIANLLLARATTRRREFAIRVVLGATPMRVVRQLLTECVLLGVLGGTLGLAFAVWGMYLIRWISPPDSFPYLPRLNEFGFDHTVLTFAIGTSILAGLVFGMVPALQLGRSDLQEPLLEGSRGATGGGRSSWIRMMLIVAETALGTIVIVGAVLLFRSFLHLKQVPLGFQTKNVLTLRVIPQGPKYSNQVTRSNFYQRVLENIKAIPGVQSAGAISFLPLTQIWHTDRFSVQGQTSSIPGDQPPADFRPVTPGYFESLRIPFKTGRDFSWADAPGSQPVAIVSDAVARRFWPKVDPLGQHIKPGLPDMPGAWLTVIGVVGDVRYYDVVNQPRATIYLPFAQNAGANMALHDVVVRTALDPSSASSAVGRAIWSVDRNVPLSRVRTMDEVHSIAMAPQRFNLLLLGVMACMAIVLAAMGLYGVTAYTVQKQTREIGIRIALGAEPYKVVKVILLNGVKHVAIGIAVGILIAFSLSWVMKDLLFAVSAVDPLTYAFAATFLCSVVLVACYFPARRAAHVDPTIALREE